jgi:hypothetical protein
MYKKISNKVRFGFLVIVTIVLVVMCRSLASGSSPTIINDIKNFCVNGYRNSNARWKLISIIKSALHSFA